MNADQMRKGASYEVTIKKTDRTYRGTYLGMQPGLVRTEQLEHVFFPEDGLTSFSRIRIHPDVVGEVEEIDRDERGAHIAAHPAVA